MAVHVGLCRAMTLRDLSHWILNIARAHRQTKTRIRSVSGETTFIVTFPYLNRMDNPDSNKGDTTIECRNPEDPPVAEFRDEGR